MDKLEVKQLGIRYEEDVFSDVSFELTGGQWLTITGESGSGKSTLLKIIAGLQDATSGEIILNGVSQWNQDIESYREDVSYAVQMAQLFGETVQENLDLPYQVREKVIDRDRQIELLGMVGLTPDFLERDIHELSGGQRQRIAVIRNLLFPPKFLLLDEISTGLDAHSKAELWELIVKMQAKYEFGILAVTHDADEIAHARLELRLQEGKGKIYEYDR
jgi:putative ABC transport system ATP-binding protein